MPKFLKKQEQLIRTATGSATVILGTAAIRPVLPGHAGTNKTEKPRRSGKGKHIGKTSPG